MKYIAVYIGSNQDFRFFSRMVRGLNTMGYQLIILSNKPSVIFKAFYKKIRFCWIWRNGSLTGIPDLSYCYDILEHFTTLIKARILYSSVFIAFTELLRKFDLDIVFIWNGLSVQTIAVSDFAKRYSIKRRYFELANLPEKMFVNPAGVNAMSSLFSNINILENYSAGESEYNDWKQFFVQFKKREGKLPQCTQRKIQNYLFLLDILAFKFLELPSNGEANLVKKIKFLIKKTVFKTFDEYDFRNKRYVFVPLQVNKDSQLVFNSDYSNVDLIKKAMSRSSDLGADLVIKIHPAETDENLFSNLIELKKQISFFIVNYSTLELIQFSLLVITINSTAGLEAMILGKEVIFIGKSFYPLIKKSHLKNYILKYLIDADYFSNKEINKVIIGKILNIE